MQKLAKRLIIPRSYKGYMGKFWEFLKMGRPSGTMGNVWGYYGIMGVPSMDSKG